jgi:inorganic phosphate transporter, PiT family
MGPELLFFLSSGLFLGWSLGANDAANLFGTAVGTRMVRFQTAALICAVFVVLGAVLGGAGAAHTLGRLGAVNTLAGAFTVALAAALTTFVMTRCGLPISTSQAIVGAIIGWNLYAGMVTGTRALSQIVLSWVLCPLLAGIAAVGLYLALRAVLQRSRIHLLRQDALVRAGLILVGAFGAFSLGANNIANVMGVFLPDNPFRDVTVLGVTITGTQLLFLVGGLAIATGIMTYSERVIRTVGGRLLRLSPEAALVVVLAQALVLFVFASEGLEGWLAARGLPTFPLVPVSSSQAVVGAIIGLGLMRGGREIRLRPLGGIGLGWIATPVAAGLVAFFLLFFVDNVFDQQVARAVQFRFDAAVLARATAEGIEVENLADWQDREGRNAMRLRHALEKQTGLPRAAALRLLELAEVVPLYVDPAGAAVDLDRDWFEPEQLQALRALAGRRFDHRWQLAEALAQLTPRWRERDDVPLNRSWNRELQRKLDHLERLFRDTGESDGGAAHEGAP